jgi:solute carrier family 23 (nucleobase transporter), member 1
LILFGFTNQILFTGLIYTEKNMSNETMIGLDDEIPKRLLIPYSLQHVLTMLGATIAVPTIISSSMGTDIDPAITALLISNVLLCMGIATCIQVSFGTRLPIIQGSSFAFIPPILLIVGNPIIVDQMANQPELIPQLTLRYISGAVILGAIFQIFVGYLGIAGLVQKILTPVVIGPVIMLIGLSLFNKVGVKEAGLHWPISLSTIALVFFISYAAKDTIVKKFKTLPILATITIIYGFCLIMSFSGFFLEGHPSHIDLSILNNSPSFIRDSLPLFSWGYPIPNITFFMLFLLAYAVSTFESLGDYNAIADISEFKEDEEDEKHGEHGKKNSYDKVSPKRVNRGVIAEGISCLISGIIGGVPTTSYSENIGLIAITRNASRKVVLSAGIILIIAGFIPLVGILLTTIPKPILGGMYCILFGMIVGIGIKITSKCVPTMRNTTIIGFTLFMAFAVSDYFTNQPQALINLKETFSGGRIRDSFLIEVVKGAFGSSMTVALFIGLVLDNVIPKDLAE